MCPSFVSANWNPFLTMISPIGIFSNSFAALLIWASVGIEPAFSSLFLGDFLGISVNLNKAPINYINIGSQQPGLK